MRLLSKHKTCKLRAFLRSAFPVRVSNLRIYVVNTCIREWTDQKKVCKFANFPQCIYADTSVLFLLTLVTFKSKSQSAFAVFWLYPLYWFLTFLKWYYDIIKTFKWYYDIITDIDGVMKPAVFEESLL